MGGGHSLEGMDYPVHVLSGAPCWMTFTGGPAAAGFIAR